MTSKPDEPPFIDYADTNVNALRPIHASRQSIMSLQAADPMVEKTTNSRSPDIQEINEDIRQTHEIYQFQNCGTVYMDSLNARGVRIEKCGNNAPQVTTYHRPRIISNENFLHSQSHAVSNGPQNATDPPTAPIEIAKSNPSNVHLQTNAPSLPQSLQPITSHSSGDHEIPTRSTFSDIGNDCPCSSNRSPPLPNSPPTGRMHFHISISMDYVMFFSCVGLVAVSYLAVFFN